MTSFYCAEDNKRYTLPIGTDEFLLGMAFIENMNFDFYGVGDLQFQDSKGVDMTNNVINTMLARRSIGKYQIQQAHGIGSDDLDLLRGAHWYLTLLGNVVDIKRNVYHHPKYPDGDIKFKYYVDGKHVPIQTVVDIFDSPPVIPSIEAFIPVISP